MTDSSKAWRRPGKGRPRNEDRAEILVHFAQEREKGLSIGDIARRGMSIYGYGLAPDGRNRTLSVLRSYAGATLERRYREYLQEVNQSVDQCVDANMVLDGIGEVEAALVISASQGGSARTPQEKSRSLINSLFIRRFFRVQ